jgi:flavin-dependent dehydrogenase
MRNAEKAGAAVTEPAIENLVIGGGLAGSMAAIRLADAGRPVTLVERERAAHQKVCGEFLSSEAVEYLEEIGIEPRQLGAVPVDRVRLLAGRRVAESALPFRALSLSRFVLDEAMLERAKEKGCEIRRGVDVEALQREGNLWRVDVRGGEPLSARTVFLATGKHDLRGWVRGKGEQQDLVGFKMHWRLKPDQIERLRGAMELFLFRDGYGGLASVEGDKANLCFVIRGAQLRALQGRTALLDGIRRRDLRLREYLDGAEALYERPLAVAPIPYGYMAQKNRGVWCVGDQAAVIPSFTGDGMSIAMHSATLATRMYVEGKSIDEYHGELHAQLNDGMRLATGLSQTMVTGVGRWLVPVALALNPGIMRWIASSTRIPGSIGACASGVCA